MGAYLNTPIREKESDDKETKTLRYGASSMQGWRMSQEDAHNCCPDFEPETHTSLFAVYDGHGGAEVAQYTAQKFPEYIKAYGLYKEGKLAQALEDAFLDFDSTLTKEEVIKELRELAGVDEQPRGEDEDDEETERAMLVEEADMPLEKLMERYGGAPPKPGEMRILRKKENIQSPVIRPKGEGLNFPNKTDIDPDSEEGDPFDGEIKTHLESKLVNGHSEDKEDKDSTPSQSDKARTDKKESNKVTNSEEPNQSSKESEPVSSSDDKVEDKTDLQTSASEVCNEAKPTESKSSEECSSNSVESTVSSGSKDCDSDAQPDSSASGKIEEGSGSAETVTESAGSSDAQPAGSNSGSSGESGSSSDCAKNSSSKEQSEEPGSSSGRTRSKRKGVIPAEGEDESSFDEDEDTTDEEEDSEEEKWDSDAEDDDSEDGDVEMEGFPPKFNEDEENEEDEEEEDEPIEEFIGGGEEPGSDSGCTAVVALLRGRELVVANAGDSRCVVCRDGKAIDMSIDHKPEDAVELSRINKAGGCVTMDGRVNGGLNLSRAIGDHCYKQNSSLPLKEQMITSLPDIKCLSLEPTDEFMVLACDGIWNVMSSQDVVSFVRERIQAGTQQLSAICEEMFEVCLAPDTSGDGTGCDNMTCIIVSFDKLHRQLGDKQPSQDGASGEEVVAGIKRRADSSGADSEGFDMPEAKKARTQDEVEADSNSNSSGSTRQTTDNGTD